jgi:hypothetical protein
MILEGEYESDKLKKEPCPKYNNFTEMEMWSINDDLP